MAQTVKRLSTMRRSKFDPWVGKIPWRRKWQPTLVLLPGVTPLSLSLFPWFSFIWNLGRKVITENEKGVRWIERMV